MYLNVNKVVAEIDFSISISLRFFPTVIEIKYIKRSIPNGKSDKWRNFKL